MVVEAMKMQNEIEAPAAGTVKRLHVAADFVSPNDGQARLHTGLEVEIERLGVLRIIRRLKMICMRSGRPKSKFSRMTCSNS